MVLDPNINTLEKGKFREVSSQPAVAVQIVDPNPVPISITGNPVLGVPNTSYIGGTVTVTTTQVQAKVGASNLTNRKMLYIENSTGTQIFYGPSGVTTVNGARLANNQAVFLAVGDAISVFLIKASGSGTAIIQEFS